MKKFQKNFFLFVILIFSIALIYACEQVESKRMLRRIEKIKDEENKEMEIYSKLQVEYAKLVYPERLYEISKKQGFFIPSEKNIVNIKEDEIDKQ